MRGSPADELRERVWNGASRISFLLGGVLAGFFAGYLLYGDAVELRAKTTLLQARVKDLENDRETMNCRSKSDRALRECEKELIEAGRRLRVPKVF